MASLTGNLVAETYKALLKTIDNDILTASEKQITDGFGGGSNVFIDSNGFLRANKYKVTNGLATQFLKADGSLDANTYLTSITSSQIITALGYTPVTNARTLTINGTTYDLSANRSWTIAGTAAVWGNISGTLSDQTDLQNALNAKFNNPTGTISQYIRGDGTLATFPAITGFVPYTGATQDVDLGTHTLLARDLVIDHASASGTAVDITKGGSGIAVNIEKSGSGEALTVVKSSGSGNAASITGGTTLISELHLTTKLADAYILSAATWNAKQNALNGTGFVKASGTTISYDNSTYLTTADAASTYQLLTNLSTDLTASATKYPSVNAVIAGLATKQNQLNGTGLVRMDGTTVSYDNNSYVTGSGSVGYISSWNATTGLTNSSLFQSSGSIGLNITNVNYSAYGRAFTGASFAASSFGYEIASGATADGGLLGGLAYVLTENDASRRIGAKIESNVVGTTATNLGANLRFYVKADNAAIAEIARMTASGVTFYSGITATSFVKTGGTSNEYLRADGSVNVITGDIISGSGTAGYLSKFNSSSVIVSSNLFESGANIGFGTITLNYGSYGRAFTGAGFGSTAFGFEAVTGSTTNGGLIGGLSLVIASNDSTRRIGSAIQSYISGATSTHQGADLRFFVKPDNGVLLEVVRMTSAGITFNKDLTAANITATTFVKSGGTASEFLMADGTVSTLSSPVSGSGSSGYIPKWTSASNLGSSNIYSDGTSIGISYTTPNKGGYGRALSGAAFGSSSFGFEVVGGTTTNGGLLGGLSFIVNQNDSSRIVGSAIQSNLVGTTATNYGADLRFFAKADGVFTIAEVARITSAGLRVYGTIVKDGGTSSQYLMADGSVSTLTGVVTGSGTTNYLPKWTSGSALGNSLIYDDGTNIGIGTTTMYGKLSVSSGNAQAIRVDSNAGYASISIGGVGTFSIDAPSVAGGRFLIFDNGNTSIGSNTDSGFKFFVNGSAKISTSIVSQDYRFEGTGYITYNTNNVGTNTFIIRNYGTSVLSFNASNEATFASSIISGASVTIGTGGNYATGSIYSDGSWGMIFRAKQASPTNAEYRWARSNDAELMRISPSGGLQVGTTPDSGYKLDIGGTGRFSSTLFVTAASTSTALSLWGRSTDNYSALRFESNNGATRYATIYTNTTDLIFETTSENLRIKNSGNILVGTVNDAGYKFDINGTLRTTGYLRVEGSYIQMVNATNPSIYLNNTQVQWRSYLPSGTYNYAISDAVKDVLTLGYNGGASYFQGCRVGINVTTPGAFLHIKGELESNYGLIVEGTYGTGHAYGWRTNGGNSDVLSLFSVTLSSRLAVFGYSEALIATGGATRLYVTGTGNVGINTTSPDRSLTVNGQIGLNSDFVSTKGGTTFRIGYNAYITTNGVNIFSESAIPLVFGTSSAEGMRLTSSQNLLVGRTADSGERIQVTAGNATAIRIDTNANYNAINIGGYGNISVDYPGIGGGRFYLDGGGALTIRQSMTASAFYESSDMRLKTIINDNPIIHGIEHLEAKLYEKNGKIELGYFAQDAEIFMPYAVTKNADGFLNLSYREVHTAKIARLEKEVAQLKAQLNLN
jgi:hypothetical protein